MLTSKVTLLKVGPVTLGNLSSCEEIAGQAKPLGQGVYLFHAADAHEDTL